ncbi:DUF4424 family protein [Hoeflea sp. Naph1]|uniref:DUF4424 family protein n=1 Tax=Hoeflea sp. Naph1 TaxID=3388653 RepID=UPI00398FE0A6
MTLQYSFSAGVLVLFFVAGQALANDAVSGYPAGGVVFKTDKDVSIARQHIDLSTRQVHVRYVFVSSAAAPVVKTIRFAMPKMPQDDTPDSLLELAPDRARDNLKNYMVFRVLVDGKPVAPKHHEFAWSGTRNLTAGFLKMGVPIFAATRDAREKLGQLPDKIKHQLAMQKLISGHGDGIMPGWDYQSVYEWQQSFAPGETGIDITYKPILGYPNDMGPHGLTDDFKTAYCIPSSFLENHAQGANTVGEVALLGYLASDMNGSIGEFHVKVDEDSDTLASLCVPAGLTATDKPMEWTAKDFTLKNDFKVLFLVP